jgi:hypothetical protein
MEQERGLFPDDLHNAGMRVTERVDPNSRNHVQVTLAVDIIYVTTFATPNHQRIAAVILQ